ncbi:hypothetical protein SMALB_0152 [Streptomyces malaysiensis]|uniref:Xylulose 5-phosphate/Fructose 6-phosphate phosphoketolase N-terminal domain-containing protein n=1 Tax=Streptomyces malaysiensis TaxID=92644 RepID=A0A7X5WWE5_STRMQ|nr:hypothetical protein [Streptomyces malaysiensis]
MIRARGTDVLAIWGPGHGGPSVVANSWLEGSYSEVYPDVTMDLAGMERMFRQFSFPGGVPSHVAPEIPGSVHEGGELGYCLAHAYGAAFDNPGLVVVCVIGDGEAETGPLAASWHSNKFLDPVHDGAVLPILHLNGYKIANPTVLARLPRPELDALMWGNGHAPIHVSGDDPAEVYRAMATACDLAFDRIAQFQRAAREEGSRERPLWPMIVLRTPKGWTGPGEVDGVPVEDTWRSHQVPLSGIHDNPEHLRILEEWLRSYRPEELFGPDGRPLPHILACVPEGRRRLGATPYANGGLMLRELPLPPLEDFAVPVDRPGATLHEPPRALGALVEEVMRRTSTRRDFRLVGRDETASNRLDAVYGATGKAWQAETLGVDEHLDPHGRVVEILSEQLCQLRSVGRQLPVELPEPDAVVSRRDQVAQVGGEFEVPDALLVSFEHMQASAGADLPHPYGSVVAGREGEPGVGCESHGGDPALVPRELAYGPPGTGVPQPDRFVLGARGHDLVCGHGQAAVGAQTRRQDRFPGAGPGPQAGSGVEIPQPDHAVAVADRREPSVRGRGDHVDRAVPGDRRDAAVVVQVPSAQDTVTAAEPGVPSVAGEHDGPPHVPVRSQPTALAVCQPPPNDREWLGALAQDVPAVVAQRHPAHPARVIVEDTRARAAVQIPDPYRAVALPADGEPDTRGDTDRRDGSVGEMAGVQRPRPGGAQPYVARRAAQFVPGGQDLGRALVSRYLPCAGQQGEG